MTHDDIVLDRIMWRRKVTEECFSIRYLFRYAGVPSGRDGGYPRVRLPLFAAQSSTAIVCQTSLKYAGNKWSRMTRPDDGGHDVRKKL